MKHLKLTSISRKTLFYLIIFSVSILLMLWISQIFYFRYSYEVYQVSNMNRIANEILNINDNDIHQEIENISYQNEVCIEVIWKNNNISRYNTLMVGCELGKNKSEINYIEEQFLNSHEKTKTYRLENSEYKTEAYLYSLKTNLGSIFLYSPLKDLSGASKVLQNQLIYLTFIAIIFACVIAYFLSHKITKPILEITDKAKKLGKKELIEFPKYEIEEIDALANVLTTAHKELAKTDELRRDLMANVSHDLKTPLTMIKAYAEMVRDISYQNPEKRIKDCNIIINETERLNLLVNDILELSKLEANVQELHLEKYNLVEEIKEIIKRYEIIKETEDYKFKLDLPPQAMVYADKNKINQVLYNLINNAINYTGPDKLVTITLKSNKDTYQLKVIDTGKGISKEEIPHIWDKYYKNEKNHRRNIVGSGIGLSICKSILEQHHFKYGVLSQKNKGTTFYIDISKNKKKNIHKKITIIS